MFLIDLSLPPHHSSGIYSASNRTEYQKVFEGAKAQLEKAGNLTMICGPTVKCDILDYSQAFTAYYMIALPILL
jgi:hypothetical protein